MSDPMIQRALDAEVVFTKSQLKRRAYEKAEKARRDYIAHIEYARDEGRVEGKIEGKLEGKLEGKIEGTKEAKLNMAEEMLKANLPMELIERVTKLSPEVLRKLAKRG